MNTKYLKIVEHLILIDYDLILQIKQIPKRVINMLLYQKKEKLNE